MADRRRGFALITVLAVMAIVSGLALSASIIGRDAFHAERNRIALEQSWWRAAGCMARARVSMDQGLAAVVAEPGGQTRVWRSLDRVVAQSSLMPASGCVVSVEAVGARIDVNAVSADALDRLFAAMGLSDDATTLRTALLERRATDTVPLPDIRALARTHGFETLAPFAAVLSTEPGRICIIKASATVLAAVPGFTPAVVQRILDMRAQGEPLNDLLQLVDGVPASDAAEMFAHYPEIARLTTIDPDAWVITARGAASGDTANIIALQERVVRNGARVSVMQTRVYQ